MALINILTTKQKETLAYIELYVGWHGISPLVTEIQKHFKLDSIRSVTQRLDALEKKGFISRNRFKHRGITVINQNPFSGNKSLLQIPIIASVGCDEQTIFAQEQYGDYLTVDHKIIGHRKDVVAFKAAGNSMLDAGVHNGDYVLVEPTTHADVGDRVVAIIGDMAVLKRFGKSGKNLVLYPESEGYSPIVLNGDFKIFGKMINIIVMSNRSNDDIELIPI